MKQCIILWEIEQLGCSEAIRKNTGPGTKLRYVQNRRHFGSIENSKTGL